LVTDPARFAGEKERGLTGKRQPSIDVAMHNFETGDVTNGAFEAGILIAANDECVKVVSRHGPAQVGITTVDFFLRSHRCHKCLGLFGYYPCAPQISAAARAYTFVVFSSVSMATFSPSASRGPLDGP